MPGEVIQEIYVTWREKGADEFALYENLPKEEQYFRPTVHPFTDDELIAIANKELLYEQFTPLQKRWVDTEKERFKNGVYAYINGILRFIPGAYWCYINYWTLEHGEKPEYREDDRIFFLFHEYLRLETECLGLTRGKGRRQGATSIGTFFMWFISGREEHKNCGMTSYEEGVAQEVFQKMLMYGFKALLPVFQEDFDSDSENFIRFVKTVEKKKKGVLAVKREGLNSYLDYRAGSFNAYDSGRSSYNMPDESGKRKKININLYWAKLYKTFLVGKKKVGFGYLPTTVNKKEEGGEEYQKFWKTANQHILDKDTGLPRGIHTPNKCVRYFVPASRCYAGCIDKFGNSVVDDPETPVMGNDGEWITEGARTHILRERALIEDAAELMEHRRDYPLDEFDMFAFATGQCEFNEANLIKQMQWLEENPQEAFWRQVRFYEEMNQDTGLMDTLWADDPKGCWWIKEWPKIPNKYSMRGGSVEPENTLLYSAGADTYRNIFAENGSDGAITIFKKSEIVNGEEMGLKPVAIFIGRPRLVKFFNKEALMGCKAYGCKINFEIDAGTWFYEDFAEWGAVRFLEWTPALDPTKKHPLIKPGTESANPFQLAKQLECAKMYFDGSRQDEYNGNIHRVTFLPMIKQALEYNHSERTPYHLIVSIMMALLPTLKQTPAPRNARPPQILRTFKIKIPA